MTEYRRGAVHIGDTLPTWMPDEDDDFLAFVKTGANAGLYVWDGMAWSTVGGGSPSAMIVLAKSSNQNVGGSNGTEIWWTWNGEDRKDAGFTHSNTVNPGRVQVDADGWYRVRFLGNVEQTGSARTTLHGILRVNGGATQRKGSVRDYTRGSGYGNCSPGLECVIQLSAGDYIEVGTRVEDTDGVYTLHTTGGEIANEENVLIIEKV